MILCAVSKEEDARIIHMGMFGKRKSPVVIIHAFLEPGGRGIESWPPVL